MKYKIFAAKTNYENENEWLPLWMHLSDTAGVMQKLIRRWLPESAIIASGIPYDEFERIAVFLAAIHDIGKATSYFQSIITVKNPDIREQIVSNGYIIKDQYIHRGKTHHAYAGQWILMSDKIDIGIPEDMAMVIGAHHGKPYMPQNSMQEDLIKLFPVNFYGSESEIERIEWEESWKNIVRDAKFIAGLSETDAFPKLSCQAQIILSGLLIIADWISSNTYCFPLIDVNKYGDQDDYPNRVNRGWKTINLPELWESYTNCMTDKMFCGRFGFQPNVIQKTVFEAVNNCKKPGIFILEAQMGIGKTEAALSAAEVLANRGHLGGIFFGLPTQVTSNAMFPRLIEWAENVSDDTVNSIELAHGAAIFSDQYKELMNEYSNQINEDGDSGVEIHPWFGGNRKQLLADFVIGTVDQFLMAALKQKFFMLRHIGLAGKVVIIDECHAYDAYMNQYLSRAISWMAAYGVKVILLSATLPVDRRKELIDSYVRSYSRNYLGIKKRDKTKDAENWDNQISYPLLTWTDGETICQKTIGYKSENTIINIDRCSSVESLADILDKCLKEGGCACVVLNTVKKAQDVYRYLKTKLIDATVMLYHAQYLMPDRLKKEAELLEHMGKTSTPIERDRFVLVGTQVLEQSLDYDADIMFTQLCPIDLLFQRIGRLHRHNRKRPDKVKSAKCYILEDGDRTYDDGTAAIYGGFLLTRTEQVLSDKIKLPDEIPTLIQRVYETKDDLGLEDENYEELKYQFEEKTGNLKELAKGYLMANPSNRGLKGIINNVSSGKESAGEATVRNSGESVEVLLLKRTTDDKIRCIDGDETEFLADYIPSEEEGRIIAEQRLKLPSALCQNWNINSTITALEEYNIKRLSLWQQNPWLKGELVLLLDTDNTVRINDYIIQYTQEEGLTYQLQIDTANQKNENSI